MLKLFEARAPADAAFRVVLADVAAGAGAGGENTEYRVALLRVPPRDQAAAAAFGAARADAFRSAWASRYRRRGREGLRIAAPLIAPK